MNMRSQYEIERAMRDAQRSLERAIDKRDWTEALHNEMAMNIFIWVLKDGSRIRYSEETVPKKQNFLKKIFTKEDDDSF